VTDTAAGAEVLDADADEPGADRPGSEEADEKPICTRNQ